MYAKSQISQVREFFVALHTVRLTSEPPLNLGQFKNKRYYAISANIAVRATTPT
jgi:hypothetical protein